MAYYDALRAVWGTLTGTMQQKLDTLNAMMVSGPNRDVTIREAQGFLLINGAYVAFANFAASLPNSNPVHDAALNAAKSMVAFVAAPNAPSFEMSNPDIYSRVKAMADAALAQELASPGSTGFTQAIHDGLLSLASTSVPWWKVNGYSSPFNQYDLVAAGGLT